MKNTITRFFKKIYLGFLITEYHKEVSKYIKNENTEKHRRKHYDRIALIRNKKIDLLSNTIGLIMK